MKNFFKNAFMFTLGFTCAIRQIAKAADRKKMEDLKCELREAEERIAKYESLKESE